MREMIYEIWNLRKQLKQFLPLHCSFTQPIGCHCHNVISITVLWWTPCQDPTLSIFTINYCFQIKQTSLICIQTSHFLKSFIKEKFGSLRDESIYSDLINKHQQDLLSKFHNSYYSSRLK